ncbi:hypothetical protein CCMA1212_008080 [Trichoderma ghanense]|uniref:BTB domain-containing protein n=1 Tax=Trichoderma ghanense TaxID=65468 RepID=A0ABY2GVC8_9HYPO
MEPKVHEIDPNGDTLLTLRNPNAPFAAPPSPPAEQQEQQEQPKSDAADEPQTLAEDKPEVRMRLSSRHLTLASAYFEKMMSNDWKETTAEGDYSYVVDAEGWDEEALLTLMNIIHGKTADLSMTINLEMLAKIAVLADYYQCHVAVKFFSSLWLQGIDRKAMSGRDLLLLLSVSCVFPDPDTFKESTMSLITKSTGVLDSLGLPIPQTVIDAVNERREKFIPAIVDGLKRLIRYEYSNRVLGCSFDCSSMFIGALGKNMDSLRLTDQYLTPPYVGHSLMTLKDGIFDFSEPSWRRFCDGWRTNRRRNTCSLSDNVRPIVETQIKRVVGLELKDFIKTS